MLKENAAAVRGGRTRGARPRGGGDVVDSGVTVAGASDGSGGKDARGTASWRAASRRMVCCMFLVMPPHLLSLSQVNMDTPPSKASRAEKSLEYARDQLRATRKKMRDVQDCDDKLFQSLKRIKNARERNKAEMEKHEESIKSLQYLVVDIKRRRETVVASPESAATDYTFPDDSQDEEMVRALDVRDEKRSGEDRKGNEKETSV